MSISIEAFRLHGRIQIDNSRAKRELKETERGAASAASALRGISGSLGGFTVGALLAKGATELVSYSARLEQTKISFETLLGSSQAAAAHLKELERFAIATPFEFEELTDASRRFLNMGLAANEVVPLLTSVGDAVAAAGGGSEKIDRVSLALSQMTAKGKVSAEEMNQLAEAGVGGWRILESQLGITKGEAIKLSEQGKISSDTFIKAFKDFSKLNFGGAMERQSHTLLGAWSTIKDTLRIEGAKAFEPFYKEVSGIADKTAQLLKGQNFEGALQTAVEAGFEAAGVGIRLAVKDIVSGLFDGLEAEGGKRIENISASWGRSLKQGLIGNWNLQDYLFDPQALEGADWADRMREVEKEFADKEKETQRIAAKAVGSISGNKPNLADTVGAGDDSAKKIGRATDLIKDLNQSLVYMGNTTAVARTQQRLFEVGLTDTSDALYRETMALASANDVLADIQGRQREQSEASLQGQLDIAKQAADIPAQIQEIEAAYKGGRTEVEKFDESIRRLRSQISDGFITDEGIARLITDYRLEFQKLDDARATSKIGDYLAGINQEIFQLGGELSRGRTPREQFRRWLTLSGIDASKFRGEIAATEKQIQSLSNVTAASDIRKAITSLGEGVTNQLLPENLSETEKVLNSFFKSASRADLTLVKEDIAAINEQVASIGKLSGTLDEQTIAANLQESLRRIFTKADARKAPELHLGTENIAKVSKDLSEVLLMSQQLDRNQQITIYRDILADLNGELNKGNELTEREITLRKLKIAGITDEAKRKEALARADRVDVMKQTRPRRVNDKPALKGIQTMKEATSELKALGKDTFEGFAQGIGSMAENFVLLGDESGASMQKMVASVLAGVTAQAATLAVMELGYGIAALTPWGAAIYGAAPIHFKAAAVFGSIAGVAGVSGRAIAGDSFSNKDREREREDERERNAKYADENNPANIFNLPRRETGGSVYKGRSYIVGEKRAEVFVPNQDGTIEPDADAYGQRQTARSLRAKQQQLKQGGLQGFEVLMFKMLERMATALESFESLPAHEVVSKGAPRGMRKAIDSDGNFRRYLTDKTQVAA